jgi:regulatory LuxR family protein
MNHYVGCRRRAESPNGGVPKSSLTLKQRPNLRPPFIRGGIQVRVPIQGSTWRAATTVAQPGPRASLPKGVVRDEDPMAELTPREVEVLRLVAAGKANKQIAVELVISERGQQRVNRRSGNRRKWRCAAEAGNRPIAGKASIARERPQALVRARTPVAVPPKPLCGAGFSTFSISVRPAVRQWVGVGGGYPHCMGCGALAMAEKRHS